MASAIFLQKTVDDDIRSARFPKRADLMRLIEPTGLSRVLLQIHRNYAFELIGSVLPPFAWVAGFSPSIEYGAYDDSLSFAHVDLAAVQIISLDFERYGDQAYEAEFIDWFATRVKHLRGESEGPIIVSDWPSEKDHARKFNLALEKVADRLPSVFVWRISEIFRNMAGEFFDGRAVEAKGTRISDRACIELARNLGLVRLTSALRTRIKAVVVDLDNTLYDGVLGEDGIEGIRITAQHAAIYKELLRLRGEGVFLAILSKNDERDFMQLHMNRADFLLRPEHFSASRIGWETKAEGLSHIAERLNIAADSILVVDDNPGEIQQIRTIHPNAHLLHSNNAEQTVFWLRHYPALNGYRANSTTVLRLKDVEAGSERDQLRASISGTDYLREMQVELTYALNPADHRARLAELSQKTNQFNTGLQRFTEVQVTRRLEAENYFTISMSMRDRFCDSGVIGAIFARVDGNCLFVEEVCISCRALGRNVESPMIAMAVAPVVDQFGMHDVVFNFRQGPRNLPARIWLKKFAGVPDIASDGTVTIAWEAISQRNEYMKAPIVSKWERESKTG